jgi:hypothetical protein
LSVTIAAVQRLKLGLVLVPLMLGGSESAHAFVERFASEDYEGAELFRHGVLGSQLLPFVVPAGLAVLFGGVAVAALGRDEPRRGRTFLLWPFALLPIAVFAVQEYVEYWAGHGRLAWALAGERPFLAGLLLQLPFALAALLAARFLLRLAGVIAGRRRTRPLPRCAVLGLSVPRDQALPPVSLHADGRLTRGPPLRSSV